MHQYGLMCFTFIYNLTKLTFLSLIILDIICSIKFMSSQQILIKLMLDRKLITYIICYLLVHENSCEYSKERTFGVYDSISLPIIIGTQNATLLVLYMR